MRSMFQSEIERRCWQSRYRSLERRDIAARTHRRGRDHRRVVVDAAVVLLAALVVMWLLAVLRMVS
jgi:hypothetical protein